MQQSAQATQQQALDFTARPPRPALRQVERPNVPELGDCAASPLHASFLRFHAENPDVYIELRTLARQMRATGRERYSINGLFEVLRWQRDIVTRGDSFKLNNNHRAFYARTLMTYEPDLAGMFELRETRE